MTLDFMWFLPEVLLSQLLCFAAISCRTAPPVAVSVLHVIFFLNCPGGVRQLRRGFRRPGVRDRAQGVAEEHTAGGPEGHDTRNLERPEGQRAGAAR